MSTLASEAASVLRANDTGTVVTASPTLYPHMWSWDAAFISIGLAHLDPARAVTELRTLLNAQWDSGMIPHTVFTHDTGYFPGADQWWDTGLLCPAPVPTSGICAPPVHALALRRIRDIAHRRGGNVDGFTRTAWRRLFRWHTWIAQHRIDPDTGLVSLVHSWESGMDNSPRWDRPYSRVTPGEMPPFARLDNLHGNTSQRPSDKEYRRYVWLIEESKRARHQPDEVVRTSSFLVGDVFSTALFAVACDELNQLRLELGMTGVGSTLASDRLAFWAMCARRAVLRTCNPQGRAADVDLRTGQALPETRSTLAGFAALLCGGLHQTVEQYLVSLLEGPQWCGNDQLYAALPTTVSPTSPLFRPQQYWRGPQWPVMTWLLGWALRRRQKPWLAPLATRWRDECLALLGDGTFSEYYHPLTGEPLGSPNQSWTAAVALDWLHQPEG